MKENKVKISVTIEADIKKELNDEKINKSKLVNWLLKNHYDTVNKNVIK